jgi:galactose-1-phosphate uridylyltransferase
MNKIYNVGDIAYYNDPYFEKLGIAIEILKVHKIKDMENNKGYIYYYSAKRLDGGYIKRYIRYTDVFDTKGKAVSVGMSKLHKHLQDVSISFYGYPLHNKK